MKTSTEAVNRHRAKQAELGRKPKQFYLTEDEWGKVKIYVKELQEKSK